MSQMTVHTTQPGVYSRSRSTPSLLSGRRLPLDWQQWPAQPSTVYRVTALRRETELTHTPERETHTHTQIKGPSKLTAALSGCHSPPLEVEGLRPLTSPADSERLQTKQQQTERVGPVLHNNVGKITLSLPR